MDSVSHTTVAHYLLGYMEKTTGISFDRKAFCFGNLKPDLSGEYLTKRHYPSLMFEETMQRIRDFVQHYQLHTANSVAMSEELGIICHYLTDFFTYPHNDDIFHGNLMQHYIYEKKIGFTIHWRINDVKFAHWAQDMQMNMPVTTENLICFLREQHKNYTAQAYHTMQNDIRHICSVLAVWMQSMIQLTYHRINTPYFAMRHSA